ncbi:nitroreductase [Pollutimonas subterranea]|uniref:Nitroreductase n=1 Tax=Pollutimonas subterranea TaxID=2045210 RepID=A0A2N4U4C0_9BURK|nr:nitroreductase [Pollutimonas subterranea]PLC49864.1 nitroreductase [Pollutimonas subterranea]
MTTEDNALLKAISTRRSVRGFLPDPVDPELIRTILNTAARAPSGNNIQPWQVHVVRDEARDRLSSALLDAFNADTPMQPDYQYYPSTWRDPYLSRRRESGWSLYELLGISKGDKAQSKLQHARNFSFFGAPAVIYITIDGDMGQGSWLDAGMFIQAFMIAARAVGLHTCPQVALVAYPDVVRDQLSIGADKVLICGISLGYEDSSHPANKLRTTRVGVNEFAVFHQ